MVLPMTGRAPLPTLYDDALFVAYDAMKDADKSKARIEALLRYPEEIDRAEVNAEIAVLRSHLLRAHDALANGGAS